MNINWTQVHDFLDVLVLVFGAVAVALLFYLRGIFVSRATLTDLAEHMEKALESLEKRAHEIERRTDGKANKDEIRRLDVEHARLDGLFQRVDHSVRALENAVDRIEGILLREANNQ